MRRVLFHKKKFSILLSLFGLFIGEEIYAASNQFGETGLLSVSTGETVGMGNVCVGIWCNYGAQKTGSNNTLMPVSLTFGMLKDAELSISYPNVLFNNDEDNSDRGFSNVTFKKRLAGTNRSRFKLALSASMLKEISSTKVGGENTDYKAGVLLGMRGKKIKLHMGGGYRLIDDILSEDQVYVDAAVDFAFHRRFRLFVEGAWRSSRTKGGDDDISITPGVQVFVTPYVTFSGGVQFNQSDSADKWKIIAGFSTCGGVGEYIVPIPKPPRALLAKEKPKGKPPVPIVPQMAIARRNLMEAERLRVVELGSGAEVGQVALAPISKYEVPVTPEDQQMVLPSVGLPGVSVGLPAMAPSQPGGAPPVITPGAKPKIVEVPVKPVKGKAIKKFRLPDLMFDTNKWVFRPESMQVLGELASAMVNTEGPFYVKVEGHTDSVGSAAFNEKLSLQRATAVAVTVMEYGVPPERVFIEGYGESRPIATNETVEGRSKNRRVDIVLIVPE